MRAVPMSAAPTSAREGRYAAIAPLLLRLFVGFVLVYGTQDNIFDRAKMLEFRDFLASNGFPYPLASAHLSAYAQFLTGGLLLAGLFTRFAALVVVVNFLVALGMVHVGLPFNANIAPLAMLVGGIFFVLQGAPRYSVDALLARRASRDAPPAGTA